MGVNINYRGEDMELGEKLRLARVEAGFSQRQLCEGIITRNMLSQIEHAAANPSMETLKQLASRLDKPVSFFLEETAVLSPNQEVLVSVRRLYDSGEYAQAQLALGAYRAPDEVYDRERQLLEVLLCLHMAQAALDQGRERYALELLDRAEQWNTGYCREELNRRRLLLLGRIRGQSAAKKLPSLDEELLLRAEEALREKDHSRAGQLLDAAQDKGSARWNYLRGEIYLTRKQYREAAQCFRRAEAHYPCAGKLEICYRELGDYKRAYEYARRQK